jgi:hypothetical protein
MKTMKNCDCVRHPFPQGSDDKTFCIALALSFSASLAQAAVLTFGGPICGGAICADGQLIDQSYGDIAGQPDVEHDADLAAAALGNLTYWNARYQTLANVAFASLAGGGLTSS